MKAEHFLASNEEYHASPGVSNSQLSVFLNNPVLYERYFVSRSWERPPPTPAMIFGSAVHEILPPTTFMAKYIEIPEDVLGKGGKRAGEKWRAFQESYDGSGTLLLKSSEIEPYKRIYVNALLHPRGHLLEDADHCEYNIRWTDEKTGLLLRARPDRVHLAQRLIVDIKTTNSVDEQDFASTIASLGYHRQAAFYQEAMYQLTGETFAFVFCAVESSRPYSVRFFDLEDGFLQAGREEVRAGLDDLASRMQREMENPGLHNWHRDHYREIVTLSQPGWHLNKQKWSL